MSTKCDLCKYHDDGRCIFFSQGSGDMKDIPCGKDDEYTIGGCGCADTFYGIPICMRTVPCALIRGMECYAKKNDMVIKAAFETIKPMEGEQNGRTEET